MNEEEKNAAAVADLMRYRALRIGCPIYGDFYGLLHRLTIGTGSGNDKSRPPRPRWTADRRGAAEASRAKPATKARARVGQCCPLLSPAD